ncbi:MAG: hypothetical protein LUG99_03270 [Lachnospiraceae bacterium]|nr:hypothetical protein [Lachnospiraceae bacterium]
MQKKLERKKYIHLMLFLLSALSFLVLGMTTIEYAIVSIIVVMVLAGVLLINNKLINRSAISKSGISLSVVLVFIRGFFFYTTLYHSSKLAALSAMLHLPSEYGVLIITIILSSVSLYSVIEVIGSFHIRKYNGLPDEITRYKNLLLNKRNLILFFLIIGSLLYLLAYSEASPLVRYTPDGDYSIFYVVGRGWLNGDLPYVQIFDHKGPLIFLIYMLGQMIGDSLGIYLFQAIALCVTLCFAFLMISEGNRGGGKTMHTYL